MKIDTQNKEIKRLELLCTERLKEIERLKYEVSEARHTQNEYESMSRRFEEVQNECYVSNALNSPQRTCNRRS